MVVIHGQAAFGGPEQRECGRLRHRTADTQHVSAEQSTLYRPRFRIQPGWKCHRRTGRTKSATHKLFPCHCRFFPDMTLRPAESVIEIETCSSAWTVTDAEPMTPWSSKAMDGTLLLALGGVFLTSNESRTRWHFPAWDANPRNSGM
jgi:hypothetical protein